LITKFDDRKLMSMDDSDFAARALMLAELDSLGILLSTIAMSVGGTLLILLLIKLVSENHRRRKYR
jgi:hypothetical protein